MDITNDSRVRQAPDSVLLQLAHGTETMPVCHLDVNAVYMRGWHVRTCVQFVYRSTAQAKLHDETNMYTPVLAVYAVQMSKNFQHANGGVLTA